jgi:FkbM family methyltransferase
MNYPGTKEILRKVYSVITKIIEPLKPFIQKRNYLGYTLFYSKGTALVERIKKDNSIYEPKTSSFLIKAMENLENPCFIDIGANIGLISLYVLKNVPNVMIYAFEPGPHQNGLFQKTIVQNNLFNSIELSELALSDKDGQSTFYVHGTKNVSGDGFTDTGRAGEAHEIKVTTTTIDSWWNKKNRPQIDVMKIDTEGSELLVINGALEMLATCKPIILTEISNLNLKSYPYKSIDVLKRLYDIGYTVYSEDGELANLDTIEALQNMHIANYYCLPN